MDKLRSSNFELLRVVSMFLIVVFHSFIHSFKYTTTFYYNKIIYFLMALWGVLSVCCFVYITAWFSVDKNYKFKFIKVLKIVLETIFYGLSITLIFKCIGSEMDFGQQLHDSILFFFSNNYWYVTAYLILLFLIPILNKIIFSLKNKDLKKLVILLTIFTCGYKTLYRGVYL